MSLTKNELKAKAYDLLFEIGQFTKAAEAELAKLNAELQELNAEIAKPDKKESVATK